MRTFLLVLIFFLISLTSSGQTFTPSAVGLGVSGAKDGGAVWADFDNDGDLDVLVNTTNNTPRSVLLQNNSGTFTDITLTNAAALNNVRCERSAVWGDLNNDGYLDFVRNDYSRIEIYINRGAPTFIFGANYPSGGTDEMAPNMIITNLDSDCSVLWNASFSINAEGVGLIDYNNDGWLDLVFENGECGIDILENRLDESPAAGTSVIDMRFNEGGDGDGNVESAAEATTNNFFRQVTTSANSYLGLPSTSGNGDYLTVGDYNGDGLLDLVIRKPTGTNSIWRNDGDGTFSDINVDLTGGSVISPSENASGGKGGVVLCDFDRDGDFDIFWSDAGPNQIWLQNPVGTFTASAKPVIPGTPDIDGCACGDVDLDGDTDLFLGNNSGNSYLFINTTSIQNDISALSFTQMDIPVNADAEGVNMIDYDGDGDYDLYVNVNNGPNQIWESDKCDGGCNFLNIVMNDCIDGTMVTRPVVGATVVLKDTNGNIVSAKVDGSTASGHGAQNPLALLIAIPNPNQDYIVDITFPVKGNNPPETHSYQFNLSQLTTPNTLELVAANGNNGSFCSFSILPVELLYFTAENNNEGVLLKWATATELNNDHFIIERSHNGKIFEELAQVQGNGTTQTKNAYSYLDPYPYDGFNYYRLAQYDYDGRATKHRIIRVKVESKRGDGIGIYPNPVRDQLTINFSEQWQGSGTSVTIHDLQGNKIFEQEVAPLTNKINIPWSQSVEGFYWVKISNQQQTVIKKLVKVSP